MMHGVVVAHHGIIGITDANFHTRHSKLEIISPNVRAAGDAERSEIREIFVIVDKVRRGAFVISRVCL